VPRVRATFLVHGDLDQAEKLSGVLEQRGFRSVTIPARGERAPL